MEASRHFIQLWHHTTADQNLSEGPTLGHAASEQFHRVRPGDTVWVVTVYHPGELVLLGRVRVGACTDQEGAERRLGTADVWEARYHVMAEPGSEQPLREVDLMGVAEDLRFVSKTADRLDVEGGRVNAQQLQTVRELTPGSATVLEKIWSASGRGKAPIDRFAWKDGDVIVTYDPSKDPNAKSDAEKRAERAANETLDPRVRRYEGGTGDRKG